MLLVWKGLLKDILLESRNPGTNSFIREQTGEKKELNYLFGENETYL